MSTKPFQRQERRNFVVPGALSLLPAGPYHRILNIHQSQIKLLLIIMIIRYNYIIIVEFLVNLYDYL